MNFFLTLFFTIIFIMELMRFREDKKRNRLWILVVTAMLICLNTFLVNYIQLEVAYYLNKVLVLILAIYFFIIVRERRKKGLKRTKSEIALESILILIVSLQTSLHLYFYYQGLDMYKKGNYEIAIFYYDEAIAMNNWVYTAYYGKATALDKLERYDEAIQWFDKAISLKRSSDFVHNGKGLTLYNEQKYDEAISEYNKAIQLNPKAYACFYNKGLLIIK